MKRAPDVAVLHQALPVGDAAAPGEALGGRHARVGHAHHHVGLGRRLGGQQLAHAAAGLVDLAAVEPAVGPRDVGELEDAQPGLDLAQPRDLQARADRRRRSRPSRPAATSRTKVAPITLSAGVSEASTQPSGARPGRAGPGREGGTRSGSRTPKSRSEFMSTKENAPSTIGQHHCERGGQVLGLGERAAPAARRPRRCRWRPSPGSMPTFSASAAVLVRLPLWPSAKPARPTGR